MCHMLTAKKRRWLHWDNARTRNVHKDRYAYGSDWILPGGDGRKLYTWPFWMQESKPYGKAYANETIGSHLLNRVIMRNRLHWISINDVVGVDCEPKIRNCPCIEKQGTTSKDAEIKTLWQPTESRVLNHQGLDYSMEYGTTVHVNIPTLWLSAVIAEICIIPAKLQLEAYLKGRQRCTSTVPDIFYPKIQADHA